MDFIELTDDEIADSIKQKEPAKPKSTRKKKEVVLERTVTGWFKLATSRGSCGNTECIDPRPSRTEEPVTMVYEMPDGVSVCRYCYLAGYGE